MKKEEILLGLISKQIATLEAMILIDLNTRCIDDKTYKLLLETLYQQRNELAEIFNKESEKNNEN